MKLSLITILICLFTVLLSADEGALSASATSPGVYTGKEPAKAASEIPDEMKGIGIEEKVGSQIDLSLQVINEKNESVALSTYFSKGKPIILSPVYFNCPGLCNFHLNGLVDTLKNVDWSPSKEFEIIAMSFDAKETAEVALKKKENYLKEYARANTDNGWHFVTASQETINKLTSSVGFKFKWNEKAGEWAHASAAIVISPEGKISRYLHGIQFEARDVKLALNEASQGKIGTVVDSVMLYCFRYDTHQSKYGLHVFRIMKIAGALTVAALALWLIPVMIRARRENT